jgi:hypothetical protein
LGGRRAYKGYQIDLFQRDQDHGIALGWIGAIMVGLGRQGVERLMLALDGRALWAAGATQAYPGAYEAEERSIIA